MDSNSQADEPPQRSSGWVANLTGTTIAAFTLIMPLYLTAYYSNIDLSVESPRPKQNVSRNP